MGVKQSNELERYLGLSNMVGRQKKVVFQALKDRVKRKVDSWSTRFLSQCGKKVFIKVVLQAIPTYFMACFLLSKPLCRELESIIARFWWQKGHERKVIHLCQWLRLCELKENGGLRF